MDGETVQKDKATDAPRRAHAGELQREVLPPATLADLASAAIELGIQPPLLHG